MLPNAITLFSSYWVGNCSLSSTCLYLSMSKGRKTSTLISCTEVMNGQNIFLLGTKYLKNTTWNKTHFIWTIGHLLNLVNSGSHTNVRKPGFVRTQHDCTNRCPYEIKWNCPEQMSLINASSTSSTSDLSPRQNEVTLQWLRTIIRTNCRTFSSDKSMRNPMLSDLYSAMPIPLRGPPSLEFPVSHDWFHLMWALVTFGSYVDIQGFVSIVLEIVI